MRDGSGQGEYAAATIVPKLPKKKDMKRWLAGCKFEF